MTEPTPAQDYAEAAGRLMDIARELIELPPVTWVEKLCADGRNMVNPVLIYATDLTDEDARKIGDALQERWRTEFVRVTGLPTQELMELVVALGRLCRPERLGAAENRAERIEHLCGEVLHLFDAIDGKAERKDANWYQSLPRSTPL